MNIRNLLVSLFLILTPIAHGGTLYVEKWGRTTSGCGAKSDPCRTIGAALSQPAVGANTRIVVGPGIYNESVSIGNNGMRLESITGPRLTIIQRPGNEFGNDVVHAAADKVRVGRRGKGFTVIGAIQTGRSGIHVIGDSARVEGNIAYGNDHGIWVEGARGQIRFNRARDNASIGIRCRYCEKGLVEANEVTDNEYGIEVYGIATRFQIRRNLVRSNLVIGITISAAPFVTDFVVRDNALELNALLGMDLGNLNGASVRSNLVARTGNIGFYLGQTSFDKAGDVRNNVAMGGEGEGSSGFSVDGTQFLDFRGNSAIQNGSDGVALGAVVSLNKVDGNNFFANGTAASNNDCAISNAGLSQPTLTKTFLGSPAGAVPDYDIFPNNNNGHDTLCFPANFNLPANAFRSKPNPYRVSRAAKL